MKPISLLTLSLLLATISAYAIQGQWQSTDYNTSKITISAISTSTDGVNNYNLQVDACPVPVSFAILQSYLKVNNLGKGICNLSDSAAVLSSSLQQKFFYFQIYYDQLTFVNIYGNKTLSFVRVKPDMRNYQLPGVFAANDGTEVTITDKSIFLCNNSKQADYSSNSKDTIKVPTQDKIGVCANNKSQEIYKKLKEAAYYRLENPSVLRLYGPNDRQVLELNKVGKWDGKKPRNSTAVDTNSTNSIQTNATSLNNATSSAPSNPTANNSTSQVSNHTNPASNSNASSSQPANSTPSPNNTLQNNITGNPPFSNNTPPFTNTTLQPAASASTSLEGTQSYINIKLTFSLATAVWYPQFFMVSDQSTWPSKIAINASNLVFIGCNTVSIPMIINYNTLAVTTGNNVFSSRKACGNADQPYIDLIRNATLVSSTANDTAFRLVFRGKNNSILFAVSRNYTASEKKNLIYAATNPVTSEITLSVGSNQTNVSTPDAKNAIGTTQSQTSTSTSTATSSTSTTVTASTSSPYPSYSSTSSSTTTASASATPTEVVATATNPSPAVSTSLLVGRYNPHKIGGTALPPFLTQNIFFVFNPAFVFITGTCNSYVYAYNMEQKGTKTLFSLDIPNRQVKKNPACDSSNDLLYLQPFEQSQLLTLTSSNTGDISLNFTDSAGNPTLSLNKINTKSSP